MDLVSNGSTAPEGGGGVCGTGGDINNAADGGDRLDLKYSCGYLHQQRHQ